MSDRNMQVIFVKQTGHVLAAFTRSADPVAKNEMADLVGTALPVSNTKLVKPVVGNGERLFVPPVSLDFATVDFEEDAIFSPLSFVVGGPTLNVLGNQVPGDPVLTKTDITIVTANAVSPAVAPAVAEDTKVWAEIHQIDPMPGDEPMIRVVEGKIEKANSSVKLVLRPLPGDQPVPVAAGDYFAVVLMAGYKPLFKKISAP
jgi:hypothetical protein